mmetsp:Transcript_25640/g.71699  ORF Transcript_25640/g.71699 Transcript_25640/m.71699 type:complete len:932 (-) Transcript_25640:97-2892(-)
MAAGLKADAVREVLAALPSFSSLDDEVQEFLAGLVADDPLEEDAAFEESLGPFLEDSGAISGEGGAVEVCAALRSKLASRLAGGGSQQYGTSTPQAAVSAPPSSGGLAVPASPQRTGAAGGSHNDLGAPSSISSSATQTAAETALQAAAGAQRHQRSGASWEVDEVARLMAGLLRDLGDVDTDTCEYIASMVAEDAGEEDATFEDTIGPFLQGTLPSVQDSEVAQLCSQLRYGLDAMLAGSSTCSCSDSCAAPVKQPEDSTAMRRLAGGPVMLGDLDGDLQEDIAPTGVMQAHLASKARKADQRLQERLNAREKEAETKRAAAEAKAMAKAEAAAQRVEEFASASYAAEATVSNRGRSGVSNSLDIHIPQFNLPSHGGGQNLLDSAMLRLMHGHRYGLVGRNGMGKSTLLATLASGRMPGVPGNLRILHVAQDSADRIVAGSRTEGVSALEAVVQSDKRRLELLKEAEDLTSGERLSQVYEALEAIDADGAPGRAAAILRGLQFSEEMMHMPVGSLSGGWRMRVSIAAALFQEPDVLCLDEPTNHLDLEAVLWLGRHLEGWGEKTLVVVSHDRSFLNEVCTDIIHLENRTLTYYQGAYDTFEAVRDEKRERQRRLFEQQDAKKKEMDMFVQKHLHKGQSLVKDDAAVKQAKKVAKQIDRIGVLGQEGKKYKLSYDGPQQAAELPEDERGLSTFTFPNPEKVHSGAAMIQVKEVTFHYPGSSSPIFRGLNFNVGLSTRCALLGRNGTGKSTLVKLITARLEPTEGEVLRSHHLRVASFTQHHMDQLNLDQSPIEHLLEHGRLSEPTMTPEEVRKRIGRFGISGHWQTQRIRTLSGGQKSRVAFCKATWSVPHILLLDEPTNHLDMDTIDSLIQAVKQFEGGIICVSHDQHFLTSVTDELWVVGEGPAGMQRLNRDFREYKKMMLRSLRNKGP